MYDNIALLLRYTVRNTGPCLPSGFHGKSAHMSNIFHACLLYRRKESCFARIFFIIRPGKPCRSIKPGRYRLLVKNAGCVVCLNSHGL